MKRAVAFLRKELAGIFPSQEIESLIFLIFEKVKGYSRTQFLLSKEKELSDEELLEINNIVARLKKHEPIQYILGTTEFYGLPFYTVPGVLIPRPETEELVQWIIEENQPGSASILDICTGSGCIAVALKKNIPQAHVQAVDISPVCIATAIRNAQLNATDITVAEYDILKQIPKVAFPMFDIIVSNPPYVRESEKGMMEKNVLEYEPALALFVSDKEPLLFYERIADFSLKHLHPNGRLYFEINEALGKQCMEMLHGKGFLQIMLKKDLNGKDRMIRAVCPF
ncbi:MAG TPA: peptide chain release factor N(5)-glutamine methyltransferase [Prolixibacteraceae bacterium]|nr:peptide chain release factor N(5)-glutamine methyltransferase [Prolixibacteraceae bacterium]